MKRTAFLHVTTAAAVSFAVATGLAIAPLQALASDPPATLCVTAQTVAMHKAAEVDFTKDTAPYADNEAAQKAISTYRMDLDEAWTAMELPYCGYGAYGTASAIKSYEKTVVRGRDAFLAAARSLKAGKVTVAAAMAPAPTPAPAPKEVPAASPAPTATKSGIVIQRGLHRGMRSEEVRQLQLLLTSYFKIPTDGDHVTGYFGPVTEGLVLKFQLDRGVISTASAPGAGLVGPLTTAALNKI